MPGVDEDDVYDMIGDEYYETLANQEPAFTENISESSNEVTDDCARYADQWERVVSDDANQTNYATENLDKYGYLKPKTSWIKTDWSDIETLNSLTEKGGFPPILLF